MPCLVDHLQGGPSPSSSSLEVEKSMGKLCDRVVHVVTGTYRSNHSRVSRYVWKREPASTGLQLL